MRIFLASVFFILAGIPYAALAVEHDAKTQSQRIEAQEKKHEEAKEEGKPEEKVEKKKAKVKEIDSEEIRKAENGNAKFSLIDVRKPKFYQKSHIMGAENIPLAELSEETLGKKFPDKKTRIIFYCEDENCEDSGEAAAKAVELEYEKIYNYTGGLVAWKKRGFAVAP